MSRLLLVSLACMGLVALVQGNSSGAPKASCEDMIPQHQVPPQKTRFPYQIKLSKNKIKAGESVDITISGKKGELFKGFLLQARLGNTPVGKFSKRANVKLIDCGSGIENSATHSNPSEKKDITITWTAPPDLKETVIFYATVAKNGGEFWVAQKSSTLSVV